MTTDDVVDVLGLGADQLKKIRSQPSLRQKTEEMDNRAYSEWKNTR